MSKYKINYNKNVQYEYMYGKQAVKKIRKNPLAFLPLGCMERHGSHLPMGLDVIKAHKICIRLAQYYGGVVFPPHFYSGIHKMNQEQLDKYTGEWGNIYTDESAEKSISDIIRQMITLKIKKVVLYTGHYPDCQFDMIKNIARKFNKSKEDINVIPFAEMLHVGNKELDHAGKTETSLMMYADIDTVNMTDIAEENYLDHGWSEESDPKLSSLAYGEEIVDRIIRWFEDKL